MTSEEHAEHLSTGEDLSLLLKQCIRLCYEKRWVTEWLFTGINSSIIRTDYVIPPNVFDQGTLLSSVACIASKEMIPPFKTRFGNIAYIPVAHLDDTTVGYVFAFGLSIEKQTCSGSKQEDIPFDVPFIARFAYDHREEGNLIFVTCGGKPKEIGISSDFFKPSEESECTFIVPGKEYTWGNLPQEPSIVFQGTKDMLKSIHSHNVINDVHNSEQFENNFENLDTHDNYPLQDPTSILNDSTEISEIVFSTIEQVSDSSHQYICPVNGSSLAPSNDSHLQQDIFKSNVSDGNDVITLNIFDRRVQTQQVLETTGESDSSTNSGLGRMNYTPWMISSDGQMSDGVSYSVSNGSAETSSGMFNMNQIKECIREVEKAMTARPFPVPKRLDLGAPDPDHPSGLYFEFECADDIIQGTLRQTCMQIYYDVVLTINDDFNFFTRFPSKEPKKIAPRPDDIPIATEENYHQIQRGKDSCICGSADCPSLIAYRKQRDETLEQRKRRNRVSAARSNEKRKARILAKKRELSESKRYIEKLKEKEKIIMRRNEELKKQLLIEKL